jgi:sodium-independent sulfate anion transporter 11
MGLISTTERYGKQVIGRPEETIPVVGVKEWISQYTSNPVQRVRYYSFLYVECSLPNKAQVKDYLLTLFPILTWITRYSECLTGNLRSPTSLYQILAGFLVILLLA